MNDTNQKILLDFIVIYRCKYKYLSNNTRILLSGLSFGEQLEEMVGIYTLLESEPLRTTQIRESRNGTVLAGGDRLVSFDIFRIFDLSRHIGEVNINIEWDIRKLLFH